MNDTKKAEGWITAPLPENEDSRIAALRRYDILDSAPEDGFDRITRLASGILKTPIALVSLVDVGRQWFKSHHGIDATETPRDMAFCAHVILGNDVMVVENASEDPRFYGNPLVADKPEIRFYAGAPLTTSDGFNLGTLCVIDMQPRNDFGDEQKAVLADLANLVIDQLELRNAIRRANFANLSKSKFIANMSHEIRTPLNVISGFTTMLEDSPLSLEQRDHVKNIRTSGDALMDIVNDVLDISKIEAGKLELENVPFNIRSLLGDLTGLFSLKAAEKYLPLLTEYETDMPESVLGDPHRIRQVLMNLVSNALKFTATGHVKISAAYDTEHEQLYCSVEDTGIGIKPEKLEHIFDDFSQADMSTTRQFGGTGLGLSICQRLMQLMGSTLELSSNFGHGSTFSFTLHLPLSDAAAKKVADVSTLPLCANVLVVEDMPFNQKVAKYTLEKLGCVVEIAGSGSDALALMKKKPYDVIFMDVQMPEMDGRETTRQIRAHEKEAGEKPRLIIAMTASALSEDKAACMECGMDEFTSKPLQPSVIEGLIKSRVG
ncbi:MAG: hybrid sensor histidine kinase/response regulator [Alphaproteobacteria bacterium]|nr:hybrid sensor histidine kinase/response regulator [Alphaproteobacteria bacterium]